MTKNHQLLSRRVTDRNTNTQHAKRRDLIMSTLPYDSTSSRIKRWYLFISHFGDVSKVYRNDGIRSGSLPLGNDRGDVEI